MTQENDLPDLPLVIGPVTVDTRGTLTGIAGGWEAIKIAQRTFQKKYCPSCIHYDPTKQEFKTKGHQNNPDNCLYHWTDFLGRCWNYRKEVNDD